MKALLLFYKSDTNKWPRSSNPPSNFLCFAKILIIKHPALNSDFLSCHRLSNYSGKELFF